MDESCVHWGANDHVLNVLKLRPAKLRRSWCWCHFWACFPALHESSSLIGFASVLYPQHRLMFPLWQPRRHFPPSPSSFSQILPFPPAISSNHSIHFPPQEVMKNNFLWSLIMYSFSCCATFYCTRFLQIWVSAVQCSDEWTDLHMRWEETTTSQTHNTQGPAGQVRSLLFAWI